MKRRVLRKISLLLGWVLGLSGCPVGVEYGMPHADFDLDGKVVEDGTTNGIPGVVVDFQGQSDTTDVNGEWAISAAGASPCAPTCTVFARDVDGDANGAYQEASHQFTVTQVGDGDGSWDEGDFQASDITIEMVPENNNPSK